MTLAIIHDYAALFGVVRGIPPARAGGLLWVVVGRIAYYRGVFSPGDAS
jgi:hypothetical protein